MALDHASRHAAKTRRGTTLRENGRALLEFSVFPSRIPATGRAIRARQKIQPVRKYLKRFLPKHEAVCESRWLRPFANTLLHPRLWHLNRHSAAGAIATGLACGLIPGPFQMPAAALCCVLFRVNLPLALLTTLYTNPFTLVPIYILAYRLGSHVLHHDGSGFTPPPEPDGSGLAAWLGALTDWVIGLGTPLAMGLVVLAALLSPLGYVATRAAWRAWLIRAWRRRKRHTSRLASTPATLE